MSTIYYKTKKINTPFLSTDITLEKVEKVLDAESDGKGYSEKINIPFRNFSWKKEDRWYEYKDRGKVYIPKHIHLTNGVTDYFIVLIDSQIELVNWPYCRKGDKTEAELFSHTPVVSPEEIKAIATSLEYLIKDLEKEKTESDGSLGINTGAYRLDWKASLEDINEAISVLTLGKNKNILKASSFNTNANTEELLKEVSRTLQEEGNVLVHLDDTTDGYNLLVVPETEFESFSKRVSLAGTALKRFL